MNILVTGAAGFIGSNYVHHRLNSSEADHVVALDALTYAGNRANLAELEDDPRLIFIEGSICDAQLVESVVREHQIGLLVHFAAESHVDRSIDGPDAFIEANIVGTHTLLRACKSVWGERGLAGGGHFHHVSTDEVYGTLGPEDPAFHERTPYAPNSPYAASKAASDHLVRSYNRTFGLRVTTSNCSNNYGPYQFPEKLIPLCILNVLAGRPLPIYGDGKQIRDWLYVEDHCRAIDSIIARGSVGDTYNVGGNNEWANIDVVRLLCALLDSRFQEDTDLAKRFPESPCAVGTSASTLIRFVDDRPGHDTRYAINAGKIGSELNFTPRENFETGLGMTVDWYLDNEAWWKSVQGKNNIPSAKN
jgi:dTDP-glucose 4,6-dehydratase